MTRQTWTALVSALCFVALALGMALLPVPYVIYGPGNAYNLLGTTPDQQPMLSVEGVETYPTQGRLDMTTVAVSRASSRVSLPEAVVAYWAPNRDALPRDAVYPKGKSAIQVRQDEVQMMDTSQQDSIVAALRAAHLPVEELPMVTGAPPVWSPAADKLRDGDLLLEVNGAKVRNADEVRQAIYRVKVGDEVKLTVWRDRAEHDVTLNTVGSTRDPKVPVVGINITTGYRYQPLVRFGVHHDIGGPSAGLLFALAIYDKITPEDILAGRAVAGTGTIDAHGTVGQIGGIQEKVAGAEAAGASIFLVPADNCRDLSGLTTKLELIRVNNLQGAVDALKAAQDPTTANRVPRCS